MSDRHRNLEPAEIDSRHARIVAAVWWGTLLGAVSTTLLLIAAARLPFMAVVVIAPAVLVLGTALVADALAGWVERGERSGR